ncbi:ribonuclease-3 [Sphingomonas sp. BE123]|uniref:ribonuclease III n=1 Tax=unclassified Sphingomonas TaxID=196159 RepID=UPI0028668381|nr:ribonuclease III [Sphingomonas sp. BE123]MDR6852230.1 ribonuclease-3 [Sphingomonas sp. BE123]
MSDDLPGWLAGVLGTAPGDMAVYSRALTHGSQGAANYERLEFLGDRVLGLTLAEWLYARFPNEPEGKLSRRFNALVTGQMCAEVAREIGVPRHLKLGKQARDDGASDSDNVLGDVMEALIGATFLDQGFDAARALVRRLWDSRIDNQSAAPKHPKSALQEWAAANNRRAPDYVLVERSGPGHAPRFRVKAEIAKLAEAEGTGSSKQEAETAAAAALLAQLNG